MKQMPGLALLALALAAAPFAATAQDWPNRPVKMVLPYPPGGSTEVMGRLVAQKMSESLGQNVIVENRGGAGGAIGSEYVAKQPADGYTFMLGTDATHATTWHLRKDLPYHPITDFTPITLGAVNYLTLVVQHSHPAGNVKELIEWVKRNPGKVSFGSAGTGSPHHLGGVLMNQFTGIDMVHVPYKGGGPALQDLLGGQIQVLFSSFAVSVPMVKGGRVKHLAVLQKARYPGAPETPAVAETLPGYEMSSWLAFFAPAGLPQPILARLNAEVVKGLTQPEVKSKLEAGGLQVVANSPEEFAKIQRADFERRGQLIRSAGIKGE